MATTREILEEITQHIQVMQEPTITRSVFNEVTTTDEVIDEDVPVRAEGQDAVSVRISYGGGEIYDIYVVKI